MELQEFIHKALIGYQYNLEELDNAYLIKFKEVKVEVKIIHLEDQDRLSIYIKDCKDVIYEYKLDDDVLLFRKFMDIIRKHLIEDDEEEGE